MATGWNSGRLALPAVWISGRLTVQAVWNSGKLAVAAVWISGRLALAAMWISGRLSLAAVRISGRLALAAMSISGRLYVAAVWITKLTVKQLRPIALTDASYKLYMHMIKEFIEDHLGCNRQMMENQAGFTSEGRVEDNLHLLSYCVQDSYDK